MKPRSSLLVIFALVSGLAAHFEPDYLKRRGSLVHVDETEQTRFRLPGDVFPSLYKVEIIPEGIENGTFKGIVEITLKPAKAISDVILNVESIIVDDSILIENVVPEPEESLLVPGGCAQEPETRRFGLLHCRTGAPLSPEKEYRLVIHYTAALGRDNRGLYVSRYEEKGVQKQLLSTHFGQQARRLMPCFDEPAYKASFQFFIYRLPEDFSRSVSNGRLQANYTKDNWTVDQYEPTTKIAPYIVALMITSFQGTSTGPEDRRFGVFARPDGIAQTAFAMEKGPQLIEAFSTWTGLDYYGFENVKKMEMGALPDFAAGAMENWGLMIHRESNILYDKDRATTSQKHRIANIISHEVSHMWFGNLVTCDWWDATWLNEGFARYFQFVAMDIVDASYQGLLQFPTLITQATMLTDATNNTHPLTNRGKIFSYADIRTMFDTITYDKGGSILRMVHHIMGNERFQAAIREYLKNNAYSNAVPEQLFVEFEKQFPNQRLVEILSTFTVQSGVPIVTATREGQTVTLTQTRFFRDASQPEGSERWTIPVTVATKAEDFEDTRSHYSLFERHRDQHTIELPEDAQFFVLNVQQVGYYRVNYDSESWNAIKRTLKSADFGGIHPINRAQIVDDLFQLARAGHLTYNFIFDIIDFVRDDKHYLPWLATINGLSYLQQRVPSDEYRMEFEWFVQWLLEPIYNHLGFNGEGDELEKLNRAQIIAWACKYNVSDCVQKAGEEFAKFDTTQVINPDFTPGVYCSANRHDEEAEAFQKLWNRFLTSNYATEQVTVLTALGCTRRKENLETLLSMILTDSIRLHDKSAAYAAAYTGNLENVDLVLDFIINNSEEWKQTMSITATLSDLSTRFTRIDQFERLTEFVLLAPLTGDEKSAILLALVRNRKNMDWDKERTPEINSHVANVKADQGRVTPPPQPPGNDDDDGGDGLAWWAWLLIVLAIVVGVGALGGGGWWAYKKYM